MATFKKFEELNAWQEARKATRTVDEATSDIRFSRTSAYEIRFNAPVFRLWRTLPKDLDDILMKSSPTS
ncbi:MAG TPA: hypothetical protein VN920_01475 [Pyrinomonadaceae bacterium]|nr:hypothetical protein [Pyrinomonadaceae bacterium]